ncbi:ABC transporter permease [Pectinatus frisingensis]|uniref:ABC transporter permease n=1 Tax=Pectinatus frisingensis TaxID=865 RepID=UPI0015F37C84|nr:ABC transporter permease subunit [Pectinatus frisingensis]
MEIFTKSLSRRKFSLMDVGILCIIFIILYAILKLGMGMNAPFSQGEHLEISLSPAMLPYYAGRSLLRMFIAFIFSLIFTLVYGYIAAKIKSAGAIMIPILDILQSIPVLGFLSVTIAALMAAFPHSLFGVECASILAIFTGQAWNMTFSFYHSLITIPKDLTEASQMLHFNAWRRFINLELPISAIGLIWNGMMSFGGGWFFLAASEAISVLGEDIHLPGIGSYLAVAVDSGNIQAMLYAMVTMLVMILLVDQFFWRPLVVWGQRFKLELSESDIQPTSFVYNILYKSFIVQWLYHRLFVPLGRSVNKIAMRSVDKIDDVSEMYRKTPEALTGQRIAKVIVIIFFIWLLYKPAMEAAAMLYNIGMSEISGAFMLGLCTAGRVFTALLLGALWTIPVGVKIGLNPKLSQKMQPIVQMAASFPANMLFPFITILFVQYNVDFEYGSILLMMLGTQWYILFNVIAGAMSIPNDLLEAADVFELAGWKKWRSFILPSIFPNLVTGLITASGGAWNASIVSELVSWKDITLTASGIGAYINSSTSSGNWNEILVGLTVMCVIVVFINHFLWHKLYYLAQTKYHLD